MKSLLVTARSALALGLVLTSTATAQDAAPLGGTRQTADASSKSAPVPAAEAKKRYRQAQERLQNLVKGGGREWGFDLGQMKGQPQDPRDRLRGAVAADFDARRQLQQSELAELENRVARIKRALEIRDAMRDTIIDQRTDELRDEMEEQESKSGKRDEQIPEQQIPERRGAENGAATAPAKRRAALEIIDAEIDFKEAEANLLAVKRAFDYAKKMNAKGYVTSNDVQEKAVNYERANLELERAREKLKLLGGTPVDSTPATDKAPAKPNANAIKSESRLLELGVDEAKAKLDSAESSYKRVEKMRASAAIEQVILDEQAEELKLAKIELERAKANLDPADGEAAADEKNRRLAKLDVDAAKAKLAKEGIRYERYKRLHADDAILGQVVDDQAVKWQRAKFEVERAVERSAFTPSKPASGGEVSRDDKPDEEN